MLVPLAAPAHAQQAASVLSWVGHTEVGPENITLGTHDSIEPDPGYVEVYINVSPPLAHRSHVMVEYVAGSSDATLDDFLWPSSGTNVVAIPAGRSNVALRIYGTDDGKTEGIESAQFRLVKAAGEPYTIGANAVMEVSFLDTSYAIPASADARRGVVFGGAATGSRQVRRLAVSAGSSADYTVRLASAPSDTVSIVPYQRTERSSDISFSPAKLTFTTSNWHIAQTVTVSAPAAADGLRYIVQHLAYSLDLDYDDGANFRGLGVDSRKHLRVEVTASTQPANSVPESGGASVPDQNAPPVGGQDPSEPDDAPGEGPGQGPGESGGATESGAESVTRPSSQHAALAAQVRGWRDDPCCAHNKAHTDRWDRVLVALGQTVADATLTAMGAAEAQTFADRGWTRWTAVVEALKSIEAG
ncbi:hypothetical protein [Candidatus Poriferisodalis sp.]|uniref:hypothetical protein n=1 Tax=Candidatus Poriferisodalis sp. TaxID=3101277 RepID=UPI003B012F6F